MPNVIQNANFDTERALYHLQDATLKNCRFIGPADGESALKEAARITVESSLFALRYPLWHTRGFSITDCTFTDTARAPIWYAREGILQNCTVNGIKALRECQQMILTGCRVNSPEFGWKACGVTLKQTEIASEYLFFEGQNIHLSSVKMQGKYSFQYAENVSISDTELDSKDAFWHARNVTVKNCTVRGEYLGWFSDGLTLIDCSIIGTQPFCYCHNLKLIRCTMTGCDLAFEYSDVQADVIGHIDSVKNIRRGIVTADSVGEVIADNAVTDCTGSVQIRTEHPENDNA